MASVKLEIKSKQSTGLFIPSIARFQNGMCNPLEEDKYKMYIFNKSSDSNLNKRKYITIETERLNYLGKNFKTTPVSINDTCRSYIGVRNKLTGKMQLVDVEWFNMSPQVKVEKTIENTPAETKLETRDKLTKSFGTAKSQKIVQQSRLKTEFASSALEELHNINVEISSSIKNPMDAVADILPPVNRDAKELRDVFNLNDLISDEEWNSLLEPAYTLATATPEDIVQWRENKIYFSTIIEAQQSIQENDTDRAVLLTYLNCLMLLASIKGIWLNPDDPTLGPLPKAVYNSLVYIFSERAPNKQQPNRRKITPRLRDKLLAHLLAVGLIACNYSLDLLAIGKDLGIKTTRLEMLGRLLGGRYSKISSFLTLTVPLAVIDPVRKRSRK